MKKAGFPLPVQICFEVLSSSCSCEECSDGALAARLAQEFGKAPSHTYTSGLHQNAVLLAGLCFESHEVPHFSS